MALRRIAPSHCALYQCVLVVMVAGCGGSEGAAPTPTSPFAITDPYPENRGQPLTIPYITVNSKLRWRDSEEIVYHDESIVQRITEIRALRISGQSIRTLHIGGNVGYSGYRNLEISPDGNQIYFALSKMAFGKADYFHIVPGVPVVGVASDPMSSGILSTPDSRGAAYVSAAGSLNVYDAASQASRTIGSGCVDPRVFSPDGQSLVCSTGGNSFTIVALHNGSSRVIQVPAGAGNFFWGARGLEVLVRTEGGVALVNIDTGASTVLVKLGDLRAGEPIGDWPMALSRDGKRFAFTTLRADVFSNTPPPENVVYSVYIETGKLQRVAVAKVAPINNVYASVGQLAFSPDSRSVVYSVGHSSSAQAYLASVQ